MTKSKCFLIFIFTFYLFEAVYSTPLGETSSDATKKDCVGNSPNVNTGFNQNVSKNIGDDPNIAFKVQIPSFKVNPNFGSLKWDPPKVPDLFKGFNSAAGIPSGINLKTNPFVDLFKSSLGSSNTKDGFKLPKPTFKFELPSFQKDQHFPVWNLTGGTDLFKGLTNLKGPNDNSKIDSNALPAFNNAVNHMTDIFKNFKGINASANFDIKGFSNLKGISNNLTTDPGFLTNFWKALNCVVDFTKSLNLNLKPLQNILKGFQGITIPPNLLENLSKTLGDLKIDPTLLNEIAEWINNLNVGLQIDPIKLEEILGGVEGLAKINAFLAPYKETIAAGLGAIDPITLTELIDGILALFLIL